MQETTSSYNDGIKKNIVMLIEQGALNEADAICKEYIRIAKDIEAYELQAKIYEKQAELAIQQGQADRAEKIIEEGKQQCDFCLDAKKSNMEKWFSFPYRSDVPAIFIGGCGRSGTTLMRVILDSHRNIACGPESDIFSACFPLSMYNLSVKFDFPPSKVISLYRTSLQGRGQFAENFFAEYAQKNGKQRWAEKTPSNITVLPFIFDTFPSAKFIHILRDGRDVACSLRTHPRFVEKNGQFVKSNIVNPFVKCVQRWVDDVTCSRSFWDDARFITIKYEDLIEQPRETLMNLVTFLDEPWDEAMLHHERIKNASRSRTKQPQNPEASEKMYTTSKGRWQKEMSKEEKKVFKSIGGKLLIDLGYAKDMTW